GGTVPGVGRGTNFGVGAVCRHGVGGQGIRGLLQGGGGIVRLAAAGLGLPVCGRGGAIAAGYGTILTYSIYEFLMRPAVEDIAAALPEDFQFESSGLALRKRLLISLCAFTAMTALVVAAFVSDGAGTGKLAIAVIGSLAV